MATTILAGIATWEQHRQVLADDPGRYRPANCAHCSRRGLWRHGVYHRHLPASSPSPGTVISIPRFFCPHCRRTHSTLPAFLPPRRWFPWLIQQLALVSALDGRSLMQTVDHLFGQCGPSRTPEISTVHRWLKRWRQRFSLHRLHLNNAQPALGYCESFTDFWQACLAWRPLMEIIALLNQFNCVIP